MKMPKIRNICALCVACIVCTLCGQAFAVAANGKDIARADITPEERQSFANSKKVALVVGISDYAPESGLRALDYAHRDALALAAELRRQGYLVKILISPPKGQAVDDASARIGPVLGRDIDYWVDQLGKKMAASEGTFLFAFSGHGWAPDNKSNYLATFDATLGALAHTGISVDRISEAIAKTGAKRRVLLIDACRNDPSVAHKGASGSTNFAKFDAARGEAILFSAEAGTRSFETSVLDGGHGVFSYFVLKGLKGAAANSDGVVGFRELADYVEAAVEEFSVNSLPAMQSPFKAGLGRGNFLLAANSVVVSQPFTPVAPIAALKPGQSFRDRLKDGGEGPEMVVIPAGRFEMGSENGEADEKPVHRVTLASAFAMGTTEVTFTDYDRFATASGREKPSDRGWGRDKRPVIDVAWNDAVAYAQWLSEQTGKRYRLPSEAEWEYAARAGTTTNYWWGSEVGRNNASCDGCGSQWDYQQTAPVKSFERNALGLYDTAGNVWEWTADCWHENYRDAPKDGSVWKGGDCGLRVLRGGSWNNEPAWVRSAYRLGYDPAYRFFNLGFRLAQDI